MKAPEKLGFLGLLLDVFALSSVGVARRRSALASARALGRSAGSLDMHSCARPCNAKQEFDQYGIAAGNLIGQLGLLAAEWQPEDEALWLVRVHLVALLGRWTCTAVPGPAPQGSFAGLGADGSGQATGAEQQQARGPAGRAAVCQCTICTEEGRLSAVCQVLAAPLS